MAEERIDPFRCENYWRVDHFSRYLFANPLGQGKTVLDAACGYGYGSALMGNNGASKVLGIDNCAATIESAGANYSKSNVSFEVADLEKPLPYPENSFELVISFETLEHLKNTESGLDNLTRVLNEDGYLIISVPGEKDAETENQFHKQHFTKDSFVSILQKRFSHVELYRQILTVGSTIHSNPDPFSFQESTTIGEVPKSTDWMLDTDSIPDSYVAVCGNQPVPEIDNTGTISRELWTEINSQLKRWKDYGLNQEARADGLEADLNVKMDEIYRWEKWGANTNLIVKHLEGQRKDLWQRIGELTAINNRQKNEIEILKQKNQNQT